MRPIKRTRDEIVASVSAIDTLLLRRKLRNSLAMKTKVEKTTRPDWNSPERTFLGNLADSLPLNPISCGPFAVPKQQQQGLNNDRNNKTRCNIQHYRRAYPINREMKGKMTAFVTHVQLTSSWDSETSGELSQLLDNLRWIWDDWGNTARGFRSV